MHGQKRNGDRRAKLRNLKNAKLKQDIGTLGLRRSADLVRCGQRAFSTGRQPRAPTFRVSQQCGLEWDHGFRGDVVGCAAAVSAQSLRWTDAHREREREKGWAGCEQRVWRWNHKRRSELFLIWQAGMAGHDRRGLPSTCLFPTLLSVWFTMFLRLWTVKEKI